MIVNLLLVVGSDEYRRLEGQPQDEIPCGSQMPKE